MRNNSNKYLFGLITVICIIVLYLNTNFYIRSVNWKYKDGYHVGDWIVFNDENLRIKTIYSGKKPVGKVIFCLGKELIIENIESQEKGFYSMK